MNLVVHTTNRDGRELTTITGPPDVSWCRSLSELFDVEVTDTEFRAVARRSLYVARLEDIAALLGADQVERDDEDRPVMLVVSPVPFSRLRTRSKLRLARFFAKLRAVVLVPSGVAVMDFSGQPGCCAEPALTDAEAHVTAVQMLDSPTG